MTHVFVSLLNVAAIDSFDQSKKMINASDILLNISNDIPVNLDHVIIIGDLDANRLRTKAEYENISPSEIDKVELLNNVIHISPVIRINDSTFSGVLNFNNTTFNESVDFSGSIFNESTYFNHAKFNRNADFWGTNFTKGAWFHDAEFNGTANFIIADFYRIAFFGFSKFNKSAYFTRTNFIGSAFFSSSDFYEPVYFSNSIFDSRADFTFSNFSKTADFSESNFKSNNIFKGYENDETSRFIAPIDFGWAKFWENVSFLGSEFKENSNFFGTDFIGYAAFYGCKFEKNVNFIESIFDKVADFRGSEFKGYMFGWSEIANSFSGDEATYLTLIKNLKDHGQFDDANDCYFNYRINYMSNLYDRLSLLTCGFGVRWERTIFCGLCTFIFFGLIYLIIIYGHYEPDEIEYRKQTIDSFWISAIALVSAPKEFGPFDKKDYFKDIWSLRILAIFERLIGWSLLILLINTLSRIMVRL